MVKLCQKIPILNIGKRGDRNFTTHSYGDYIMKKFAIAALFGLPLLISAQSVNAADRAADGCIVNWVNGACGLNSPAPGGSNGGGSVVTTSPPPPKDDCPWEHDYPKSY
jgi:hypothetical protein